MYRVVSKCLDHRGRWLIEAGPWLASYDAAADWAEQLRRMGYIARVDSMAQPLASDDFDLHDALANMA